ncbi:Trk-type K+ transport system membrane component [Branchiibius hedensis]|uniref:Trk-type K+ transport system, membrane component n=1 Tax=Branchiibius hedensis TaxID=672460 RepID=A0A2Y8ZQX9_9MICO|nr:potassium transporter TrkG [Branchiibius hedensis]PWJ25461.1 Trk-type K+ transport system membrane component [Branchiibius hedensis]SSA34274.1 Trk-type K+ transport system, membrane component [Branchiibius hedensis]
MSLRDRWHVPAALLSPVRAVPLVFAVFILLGTGLLLLPWCHDPGASVSFMQAFFTATSAVTVTGLATVDIGSHFSWPGQLVILLLAEFGGIGIILVATTLGVLVGGRIGLRMKLASQTDLHVTGLGQVGPLFRRILLTTLFFQGVTAIILVVRYRMTYFDRFTTAAWHGIFDSVMAFNNAGLSLQPTGLAAYAADPIIVLTITFAVLFGTVGFPVLAELRDRWRRPDTWTIHTRLTVWGSLLLVAIGWVLFLWFEWTNAGTIGAQSVPHKIMTGLEGSVMPRSGGLATFNWGDVRPETMLVTVAMMLIGGGSASTAGGIKVTTFFLLAYVVLAEIRGDEQVRIGRRAISAQTIRTALSIALIGVALAVGGTLALLLLSDSTLPDAAFEATSAFGTTGLSTGLTPHLSIPAQLVVIALMFVGRVGTITAASAFAMRRRKSRFRLPEEQPIIG